MLGAVLIELQYTKPIRVQGLLVHRSAVLLSKLVGKSCMENRYLASSSVLFLPWLIRSLSCGSLNLSEVKNELEIYSCAAFSVT